VKLLMAVAEVQLLKYMTQHHQDREKFWWLVDDVMSGVNDCRFKNFRMFVEATRMSGEMTTSLSNGFSNLMFFLFTASECGLKNIKGVVEGDDGLFSYDLPPGSHIPNERDFAKLGLTIKIERHAHLSTASFCGMVFDPVEQVPLTDPFKALSNLGWIDRRFTNAKSSKLRSLLRCKALSMKSQYPGCPILDAAASWVLRCTAGCQTKKLMASGIFGTYRTEQMKTNINGYARFERISDVGTASRQLMSDKYDVPVGTQLLLEQWFDTQTSLSPIPCALFGTSIPEAWKRNFEKFVTYNGCEPIPDFTPDSSMIRARDLISQQIVSRPPKRKAIPRKIRPLFQHSPIDTAVREALLSTTPP